MIIPACNELGLTPESGIYIVTLTNTDPISVNAHDRRIAERCIEVTKANCKIGRTTSFRIRERNYWRTFGKENVTFRPIALLPDPHIAERVIRTALREWRVRGKSGRRTEWLERISAGDAERMALEALDLARITFNSHAL